MNDQDEGVGGSKAAEVVEAVLGSDGLMSKAFPGYEPRPQQIAYARWAFEAMAGGTNLLAEGPTGTGKSVGYLVPGIWHVTEGRRAILDWRERVDAEALAEAGFDAGDEPDERRVDPPRLLVVTANIALQEQLVQKDLPLLAKVLPWRFDAAIAKGRNNYLCLDRLDDSTAELLMEPLRNPDDRERWNEVLAWRARTSTGDFSELPFEVGGNLRQKVATTSDDCTRKACARYQDCFAERARKRFREANVIVTNYHMLFAHLAIADEFGVGVLPRFDLVVLDEVHEAADVAREFFGFAVREGAFKWATRFLGPKPSSSKGTAVGWDLDAELRNRILEDAGRLFGALKAFRASPKYRARLVDRFRGDWPTLVSSLRRAADVLDEEADLGAKRGDMPSQRQEELRKARRRCSILARNLEMGLDPQKDDADEEWAFFLEEEKDRVALRGMPIDVDEELRKRLFQQKAIKSVVATSATMTTSKGSKAFDFVVSQLGCSNADELIVPSPFDFREQALLIVPKVLPDPKAKEFSDEVAKIAVDVVRAARGRTLGLFTSHRGVRAAAQLLRRELGHEYAILAQGDAPRTQLVARFRADVSSVLLGTRSLWAGVDVSGEALSVVLIDKLPFDPPDDPILDALNERNERTFVDYSIPRAAIALRQGFGRLVRSKADRGVVVLCDRRLERTAWGKRIRAALPDARVSDDVADVAKFLDGPTLLAAGGVR